MLSPLRSESKASFSTYEKADNIYWKDFGSGESGDVISFIMQIEGLNFNQAVHFANEVLKNEIVIVTKKPASLSKTGFKVSVGDNFSDSELNYWAMRGIFEEQLQRENIKSLKVLMRDGKFMTTSCTNNPKFVFKYNGEDSWKVYSPLDVHYKWLSSNIIEPFEVGESGFKDLVVLSSKKDRMVFENLSFPISTISLHSETNFNPFLNELDKSLSKYDRIFCFLDFDNPGQQAQKTIEQKSFGRVKALKIKEEILNHLLESGVKDIDDFYLKFGQGILKDFVSKVFKENL